MQQSDSPALLFEQRANIAEVEQQIIRMCQICISLTALISAVFFFAEWRRCLRGYFLVTYSHEDGDSFPRAREQIAFGWRNESASIVYTDCGLNGLWMGVSDAAVAAVEQRTEIIHLKAPMMDKLYHQPTVCRQNTIAHYTVRLCRPTWLWSCSITSATCWVSFTKHLYVDLTIIVRQFW